MPVHFFKSSHEADAFFEKERESEKNKEFRSTSFLEVRDWSIAQNFKVFSSAVAREIAGTEAPNRPQFDLEYNMNPKKPVALLVGNPVSKFLSACKEDKMPLIEALGILKTGQFPSFHFLPQSRYLHGHDQPIYAWLAPDHIDYFWKTMEFGMPPEIYHKSRLEHQSYFLSENEKTIREIYADDFYLYESISKPRQSISSVNKSSTMATMLETFYNSSKRFLRAGFATTPPEALATREATCRACPEWDATALNNTGRCRKCGCSTWAKLRMATERCPIGKWEAVDKATN